MKKTYKLIQEYPDSPKIGTIASEFKNGNIKFDYKGKINYVESEAYDNYFEQIIKKNPKFWQLNRDFEILSFFNNDSILNLQSNGKYFNDACGAKFDPYGYFCGHTENEELNEGSVIHSIKRLSDGCIFTIGDYIYTPKSNHKYERVITSFKQVSHTIVACLNDSDNDTVILKNMQLFDYMLKHDDLLSLSDISTVLDDTSRLSKNIEKIAINKLKSKLKLGKSNK